MHTHLGGCEGLCARMFVSLSVHHLTEHLDEGMRTALATLIEDCWGAYCEVHNAHPGTECSIECSNFSSIFFSIEGSLGCSVVSYMPAFSLIYWTVLCTSGHTVRLLGRYEPLVRINFDARLLSCSPTRQTARLASTHHNPRAMVDP